jgi:hypothetical protein
LNPKILGGIPGVFLPFLEGAAAVAELPGGACREQGLPHHRLAREELPHVHVALVLCVSKFKMSVFSKINVLSSYYLLSDR